MAAILASVCLAFLVATVLTLLWWQERKKSLWVRLQPTFAILVSLLFLWCLLRYGDAVLHWIRQFWLRH